MSSTIRAHFDGEHFVPDEPVKGIAPGERVEVRVAQSSAQPDSVLPIKPDFRSAIGSYYRDYPDEPRRDSREWLKELRSGDED